MKKFLIVGAILLAVVVTLGAAGLAYAQSQTPGDTPTAPVGPGMMGRGGMMGHGGMMGRGAGATEGAYGPLHTYMQAAFAEALGLTPEELQERHDAGETMWDIALAQNPDLTQEAFAEMMTAARTEALNAAVADGAITQEQADWMIERMNSMHANGFGPGSGQCQGGAGMRGPHGGGMGGGRWNRQAPAAQPQG